MGIPTQLENYIHRSGRTGRAGAKGTSMALVGFKESRILLAWSRRGGLTLDWRAVPTPAEIREAQALKLLDGVKGAASAALLNQATQMLKDADPVRLVAGLLGLVQADQSAGFDLPNEPERKTKSRFDIARERKDGGPRPQRTYAERTAARGAERTAGHGTERPATRGETPRPEAASKTRPDGSFKPRSGFDDKPRPYKPRTDAPAPPPKKAWEDRAAKPAPKDTPRPWKAAPAKTWKKK
jgi:ATP-dependent RNA helicase DeaD